jgi:hypothetical protein
MCINAYEPASHFDTNSDTELEVHFEYTHKATYECNVFFEMCLQVEFISFVRYILKLF